MMPGDRVRLRVDVAPYPLGLFPAGTTGVVTEVCPHAPVDNPVAFIRLDGHFPALDAWDNILDVYAADGPSEVVAAFLSLEP